MAKKSQNQQWYEILRLSSARTLKKALEQQTDKWLPLVKDRYGAMNHTSVSLVAKLRNDQQGTQIISILLNYGADINALNALGQTALYVAIAQNKPKVVQVLLSRGTDLTVVDQFSYTALDYAKGLERTEIVMLIQESMRSQNIPIQTQQVESSKSTSKQQSEQSSNQSKKRFEIPQQSYQLCKINSEGKTTYMNEFDRHQLFLRKSEPMAQLLHAQPDHEEDVVMGETWHMLALKVIDELIKSSVSFWFRHSVFAGNKPGIDMSVIRTKILHKCYHNTDELTTEIRSIWLYCKEKYQEKGELTKQAEDLFRSYTRLACSHNLTAYDQ